MNIIKQDQINKYLRKDGTDFIEDWQIVQTLNDNVNPEPKQIDDILEKSLNIETLTSKETALLLNVEDKDVLSKMREYGAKVKKKVYDNRIVTFAPLYLGNLCINNCLYCGFRKDNVMVKRKALTLDTVRKEVEALTGQIGHKRLILVYGEHPETDIDFMVSTIKAVYQVKVTTKKGWSQIRRVNVNAPPLSIEDLRQLKGSGIGTYQVFQETYHHNTYAVVHPKGTIKADYRWRLYSMHRAFEAGIDDVGIGALFGLYNWKFEVMGLLCHSRELEEKFSIGPHTISFPRLEPATGAPISQETQYKVKDEEFKKLITVIRLAVPYTGMIVTARETPQMRREAIPLGCTQTDASTKIGLGDYSKNAQEQEKERQQFILGDTRSLDDLVKELAQMGYITSFCTAGYRCGRTGKCIMDLLRNGQEGEFCKLNAILTFREWLDDFATEETKHIGEKVLNQEITEIKDKMPAVYPKLMEYYEKIKKGKRDLYF